jgi:hypothetical protein
MIKNFAALVVLSFVVSASAHAVSPAKHASAARKLAQTEQVVAQPAPSAASPAGSGAVAPSGAADSSAVSDAALDELLAGKITPIQDADHRCGGDKGGFAVNTKAKRLWQTGDGAEVGVELEVKSLSVSAEGKIEASADLAALIHYTISGSWSELTVTMSGDGAQESFKLACK